MVPFPWGRGVQRQPLSQCRTGQREEEPKVAPHSSVSEERLHSREGRPLGHLSPGARSPSRTRTLGPTSDLQAPSYRFLAPHSVRRPYSSPVLPDGDSSPCSFNTRNPLLLIFLPRTLASDPSTPPLHREVHSMGNFPAAAGWRAVWGGPNREVPLTELCPKTRAWAQQEERSGEEKDSSGFRLRGGPHSRFPPRCTRRHTA